MVCAPDTPGLDGVAPRLLSPLNLAFVGDTVYDLMVRERLVRRGSRPVGQLHKAAVNLVCARAQSLAYGAVEAAATEEELQVLKRGRNAHTARSPKNSSVQDYRRATAVEALLGYLYLCGERQRLAELGNIIFGAIEGRLQGGEAEAKTVEANTE